MSEAEPREIPEAAKKAAERQGADPNAFGPSGLERESSVDRAHAVAKATKTQELNLQAARNKLREIHKSDTDAVDEQLDVVLDKKTDLAAVQGTFGKAYDEGRLDFARDKRGNITDLPIFYQTGEPPTEAAPIQPQTPLEPENKSDAQPVLSPTGWAAPDAAHYNPEAPTAPPAEAPPAPAPTPEAEPARPAWENVRSELIAGTKNPDRRKVMLLAVGHIKDGEKADAEAVELLMTAGARIYDLDQNPKLTRRLRRELGYWLDNQPKEGQELAVALSGLSDYQQAQKQRDHGDAAGYEDSLADMRMHMSDMAISLHGGSDRYRIMQLAQARGPLTKLRERAWDVAVPRDQSHFKTQPRHSGAPDQSN
jgi:hypothetical protein